MLAEQKFRSSSQKIYDSLLCGVSEHIMESIGACGMTTFNVWLRYVDNAPQDQDYHEWLALEFPEPKNLEIGEYVDIPNYATAFDIIEVFERAPALEGTVDDEYLKEIGSASVILSGIKI